MTKEEEVRAAMLLFDNNKPHKAFEELSKTRMGFFAVIDHLHQAQKPLTSKEISDAMGVSSARMTVLLKKMEGENFLKKEHSPSDARAILVSLTEKGQKKAVEIEQRRYRCMEKILEVYTLAELQAIFEKLTVIHDIFNLEMAAIEALDKQEEHPT